MNLGHTSDVSMLPQVESSINSVSWPEWNIHISGSLCCHVWANNTCDVKLSLCVIILFSCPTVFYQLFVQNFTDFTSVCTTRIFLHHYQNLVISLFHNVVLMESGNVNTAPFAFPTVSLCLAVAHIVVCSLLFSAGFSLSKMMNILWAPLAQMASSHWAFIVELWREIKHYKRHYPGLITTLSGQ